MQIDDKTNIPLFAVLAMLPFLIGGILWLASIDAKATAANVEAVSVKELLVDIRARIINIENRINKHGGF